MIFFYQRRDYKKKLFAFLLISVATFGTVGKLPHSLHALSNHETVNTCIDEHELFTNKSSQRAVTPYRSTQSNNSNSFAQLQQQIALSNTSVGVANYSKFSFTINYTKLGDDPSLNHNLTTTANSGDAEKRIQVGASLIAKIQIKINKSFQKQSKLINVVIPRFDFRIISPSTFHIVIVAAGNITNPTVALEAHYSNRHNNKKNTTILGLFDVYNAQHGITNFLISRYGSLLLLLMVAVTAVLFTTAMKIANIGVKAIIRASDSSLMSSNIINQHEALATSIENSSVAPEVGNAEVGNAEVGNAEVGNATIRRPLSGNIGANPEQANLAQSTNELVTHGNADRAISGEYNGAKKIKFINKTQRNSIIRKEVNEVISQTTSGEAIDNNDDDTLSNDSKLSQNSGYKKPNHPNITYRTRVVSADKQVSYNETIVDVRNVVYRARRGRIDLQTRKFMNSLNRGIANSSKESVNPLQKVANNFTAMLNRRRSESLWTECIQDFRFRCGPKYVAMSPEEQSIFDERANGRLVSLNSINEYAADRVIKRGVYMIHYLEELQEAENLQNWGY